MRGSQPRDDPRVYFGAFVVLLATAVAFPDGFLFDAIAAGVVVVVVTIVLAIPGGSRKSK